MEGEGGVMAGAKELHLGLHSTAASQVRANQAGKCSSSPLGMCRSRGCELMGADVASG